MGDQSFKGNPNTEEHIKYLEESLKATFNILEDFSEEKKTLEDLQKAAINILEDFNSEKLIEKRLNEELKIEIEKRKEAEKQLELSNKELEAFSFSISHDLRAPLRAVHGFSKILMEQYQNKLDEDGRELLSDILRNTENMGQLIDDILQFSRLNRKEIKKLTVNMSNLAKVIYDDIMFHEKGRDIDCEILELPSANADYALIKQVFVNLISNAVKFTAGRNPAKIEIGAIEENREKVYWIKDNGAGFDMKYVEKLFGVFQRLHRFEEFEGTGIGLAIVKRIIERHGGRVWAIGELNIGAEFYFTLPE